MRVPAGQRRLLRELRHCLRLYRQRHGPAAHPGPAHVHDPALPGALGRREAQREAGRAARGCRGAHSTPWWPLGAQALLSRLQAALPARAPGLRAALAPSSGSLLTVFSPPSVVTAAPAAEHSRWAPSITEVTGGPGEDVTAGWPLSWTRAAGGFSLPSSVLGMYVCPLFLHEKALQGFFKSTVKL